MTMMSVCMVKICLWYTTGHPEKPRLQWGRQRGVWGTSDGSTEAGVGQKGDEFLGQVESVIQEVCGHVGSRERERPQPH